MSLSHILYVMLVISKPTFQAEEKKAPTIFPIA